MQPRIRISVLGAACTLLLALIGASTARATDQPPAPLQQEGRWIVDDHNRVVILHGVNVVPTAPDTTAAFDDDDAAFLAANGLHVVRLGWQVSALEPQPGQIDDGYLDTLQRTVELLGRHGIYSLVDMHQDEWGPTIGIRGFPGWMTLDDGLLAPLTGGMHPIGYWTSPAINRAWKNFWANKPVADGRGVQDVFATQWQHVAARFAGNPWVLGYDTLNEPYPGEQYPYPVGSCWNPLVAAGCPDFDAALGAFNAKVVGAIHAVDPEHIAWYEAGQHTYTGRPNHLPDTASGEAGLSMHAYCLEALAIPRSVLTDAYCEPALERTFAGAVQHAEATGDAVLFSEFGATRDPAYWQQLIDKADRHMVPWTLWSFGELAGSWATPGQPVPNEAIRAQVVRPFPERIAGTPTAYGFDATTRTFTLTYRTATPNGEPATAQTEIFVPVLHYPAGYSVAIDGGVVVPNSDPQRLLVRNTDADTVTVVVHPA